MAHCTANAAAEATTVRALSEEVSVRLRRHLSLQPASALRSQWVARKLVQWKLRGKSGSGLALYRATMDNTDSDLKV